MFVLGVFTRQQNDTRMARCIISSRGYLLFLDPSFIQKPYVLHFWFYRVSVSALRPRVAGTSLTPPAVLHTYLHTDTEAVGVRVKVVGQGVVALPSICNILLL